MQPHAGADTDVQWCICVEHDDVSRNLGICLYLGLRYTVTTIKPSVPLVVFVSTKEIAPS